MQGQPSAVGSLPEVIGFEHGSTSSDADLDQQIFWNSISNSGQSRLPNFMVSSGDANMQYVTASNHHGQPFSGWDFGESSSRVGQNPVILNVQKSEHVPINASNGSVLQSEIQLFGPSNVLSASNCNVNPQRNGVEDENETILLQNSGSHQLSQDLNMNSGLEEDDDCQVLEGPPIYKPGSSRNQPIPFSSSSAFASSSSDPFGGSNENRGYLIEDIVGRQGGSSDGRRFSCKRKILEGSGEQSYGSGSTSYIQHSDSSLCPAIPGRASASGSLSAAAPMGGSHSPNLLEQVNPSYGSSFRRVASQNSQLLANSGTMESSQRNSRLRMNGTYQQGSLTSSMFSTGSDTGNINLSSSQHLLRQLPQNSLAIRPTSAAANANSEAQSVAVQLSSLHRNQQSRWNSASGLRSGNSSNLTVSGERSAASFEPSNSGGLPRSISDYPMFAQLSAPSWGLAGGNVNNPGNVVSSQSGVGANANPAAPSWSPNQNPLPHPSRLSESVRRALLSAVDSVPRIQNSSSHSSLHSGPSSSQEVSLSSGSRRQGRHSHSRSAMLLERHLDGAPGIPFSLRALAAANEGRSRLMTEIRNALELVRRGEGLRFQDAMILDQSVFFGMSEIHDRHRDMRLDVDNMSYEELLALEERIGSVNTGLSEESVVKQLKLRKLVKNNMDEAETEPCCICQEEYNDGEDVGKIDCGHDFHAECIKQWLMHKNLCPICKTAGLTK